RMAHAEEFSQSTLIPAAADAGVLAMPGSARPSRRHLMPLMPGRTFVLSALHPIHLGTFGVARGQSRLNLCQATPSILLIAQCAGRLPRPHFQEGSNNPTAAPSGYSKHRCRKRLTYWRGDRALALLLIAAVERAIMLCSSSRKCGSRSS